MEENQVANKTEYQPISVGDWIITMLLCSIPIVNFVMLCVWAFGSNTHPSKKNYAKATLLVLVILTAIGILIAVLFGVLAAVASNGTGATN